jgi:hypothetical protein
MEASGSDHRPKSMLLEGMGEIPLLQGLIQSQDGSILLLNLEQLFKSSQTRSLLEAVDTLTQSLGQNGSTGSEVPQLLETPLIAENAKIDAHVEPDLQPAKQSKKRTRKKVNVTPDTKEVAP